MLKHLIEKDFAQPPEFDLANELDCRPNCIPGGAPAAFIHITGTQAAPGARGPPGPHLRSAPRRGSQACRAQVPHHPVPLPPTPQPRLCSRGAGGHRAELSDDPEPPGPGVLPAPTCAPHVRGSLSMPRNRGGVAF